ncbi:hypothetical protein Lal_00025500 [Lupinus albus]|nr:hypothetical protein Lal_00025500 [Lupinus albus]
MSMKRRGRGRRRRTIESEAERPRICPNFRNPCPRNPKAASLQHFSLNASMHHRIVLIKTRIISMLEDTSNSINNKAKSQDQSSRLTLNYHIN